MPVRPDMLPARRSVAIGFYLERRLTIPPALATLRPEPYRYFREPFQIERDFCSNSVIVHGFARCSVPIPRSLVKMSRLSSGVSRGLHSRAERIDRADWQQRAPISILIVAHL